MGEESWQELKKGLGFALDMFPHVRGPHKAVLLLHQRSLVYREQGPS